MTPPHAPAARVRRGFVQVGARSVHLLRAGEGPPAVLIHSSPASSALLADEIERLARDFTVFAPDTPGFGWSDELPLAEMTVADLADALADTLAALGLPPCPMYGTHTGAAVALEFGARHPDRLTGLVLDGVPLFTPDECDELFGPDFESYFRRIAPSDLGGHYAEAWTRMRDQSVWFPWFRREPGRLNPYDLGLPDSTHRWVSMFFDAAESYVPAYRAALASGPSALRAAAGLTVPAVFTATRTDMLRPHLDRLPKLGGRQSIEPVAGVAEKLELISRGFATFDVAGEAPAAPAAEPRAGAVLRTFHSRDDGQTLLRLAGARSSPPLLLLHDSPGSAEALAPLIAALSETWRVIAPDLPGCGGSDPLAPHPTVVGYAGWAAHLLADAGAGPATVLAIGFGASVGVELARARPALVRLLAIQGLLLPDAEERRALAASHAPPIPIEPDGSHWYRTWLMLRDSQVWWPWHDRRIAAARRRSADLGAARMHRWTVDVMRRRETWAQPIAAAFAHDAARALAEVRAPVLLLRDERTPLGVYDEALAALRPRAERLDVCTDPITHAAAFTRMAAPAGR